jgi:tripartite-type tricarboxylate transporter receptor subunit TctC
VIVPFPAGGGTDILGRLIGQWLSERLGQQFVIENTRFPAMPEIPSVNEFLPGYQTSYWFGFGAPRNSPAEVINILNKEINLALADSKIKARLDELGGAVIGGSSTDFGKLISDDTERWGKVIRAANIKAE